MPNWCYTDIYINCEDKEKLRDFYCKIEDWTSKNYKENGFGLDWLGNIVGNSGIGTIDENKDTDLFCRGWLEELELENDDTQLWIRTNSAWQPALKMWDLLVKQYIPEAELVYSAEECGEGLFNTNDPILHNCWRIGNLDEYPDDIAEWFEYCDVYEIPEKELIEILQKGLNTTESDINELLERFKELLSSYDCWFDFCKWETIELEECV